MTHLDRRRFLQGALGAAAFGPAAFGALSRSALARAADDAPASDRVLVILQLAGGNDGLSTFTPWDDDLYYRGRGVIGLPKKTLLRLDDLNGFHPALPRLAARYERGQMGIHQAVGYPDPNLSHFRSQDVWDTASTAGTLPSTGWAGRLYDGLADARGNAVGMLAVGRDSLPLGLRADRSTACVVPNLASYRIRNAPESSGAPEQDARARAIAALNAPHAGGMGGGASGADAGDGTAATGGGMADDVVRPVTDAFTAATTSIAQLESVLDYTPRAEFPDHKLGHDFRLVARALGAGLPTRVVYVTLDGFDTHTEQLRMQDMLLGRVDGAVDAFLEEMETLGRLDDVLVLCISEFGRRVEECGVGETAGSDHGAANALFALGGKVNPGLHGGQPDLAALDEVGNLVMRTDFRQVYASVVRDWMGGDPDAILGPGFEPVELLAS